MSRPRFVSPQMLRRTSLFTLELKLYDFLRVLERHYSPNQPRVLAGNPDGGQWTAGAGAAGGRTGNSSRRVAMELTPLDAAWSEVSKVDGVNLIFSVGPADRHRFEGKVIDYTPERTFFLRPNGAQSGGWLRVEP
jgi:hypothetical protein